MHPVSDVFEPAKSVAHVPLGIYSIIAPYLSRRIPELPSSDRLDQHDVDMVAFKGPGTKEWISPLQDFGATLTTARRQLGNALMARELEASCARILDAAIEFIDESARRGSFDMASFETFTGGLNDAIDTNIKHASQAQIDGVKALMGRWRDATYRPRLGSRIRQGADTAKGAPVGSTCSRTCGCSEVTLTRCPSWSARTCGLPLGWYKAGSATMNQAGTWAASRRCTRSIRRRCLS